MSQMDIAAQPRPIDDDDLHGDTHTECSNEVCWAADRMHLGFATSVKESYIHLLEHCLKADVLCINGSNGTFIKQRTYQHRECAI